MRTINLIVLSLLGVLLLVPSGASAQAVDKWTLRIYLTGAASPLSAPTDLLAASVLCNQPSPVVGVPVNPTRVVFDDPVNVGKVCIWTDPGTGPLLSLPFGVGGYEGTLTATADGLPPSLESVRAPFTRPGLTPGVPTGLRFVPR
jgi:hypothetical protein